VFLLLALSGPKTTSDHVIAYIGLAIGAILVIAVMISIWRHRGRKRWWRGANLPTDPPNIRRNPDQTGGSL
jgi:hypothetical protein